MSFLLGQTLASKSGVDLVAVDSCRAPDRPATDLFNRGELFLVWTNSESPLTRTGQSSTVRIISFHLKCTTSIILSMHSVGRKFVRVRSITIAYLTYAQNHLFSFRLQRLFRRANNRQLAPDLTFKLFKLLLSATIICNSLLLSVCA